MTTKAHVYYYTTEGGTRKRTDTVYDHVQFIRAGSAAEILGPADADGNGIPRHAPLIQLVFDNGETATFDAENVTVMF